MALAGNQQQDSQDVPASGWTPPTSDGTKDVPASDPNQQQQPKQDAPQTHDLTGYGPLEGIRWLKDQAGYQFAGMSISSTNPGFYVRQQQDLMKKIDGFGQNLSMADAQHVWENSFKPNFEQLQVKGVQDDYDARGKALLDQVYAPMGHGDTKPKWDQIPKAEREAAVAYAVVSLFTGKGGVARAIQALNRPLTMQEEENQKKEAERLQNEELRRQGLLQQFNVLLGNEKQDVANIQQGQRENAAIQKQQNTISEQENRAYNGDIKALENKYSSLVTDPNRDSVVKKGLVDQWEKERAELDARYGRSGGWKVAGGIRDQAGVKSSKEKANEQMASLREERLKEYKQSFPKKLQAMDDKHLLTGVNIDSAKYKLDNILPWTAKSAQEHYQIQVLTADKLNAAKLNGWVTKALDTTILKDASGKVITDAAGNPIHTVGEARAKVADIDQLVHQNFQDIGQDLTVAGVSPEAQSQLQAMVRQGLDHGSSASEMESFGGGLDPSIMKRLIATEKMRRDNQALREKLGTSSKESAGRQQGPSVGEVRIIDGKRYRWDGTKAVPVG